MTLGKLIFPISSSDFQTEPLLLFLLFRWFVNNLRRLNFRAVYSVRINYRYRNAYSAFQRVLRFYDFSNGFVIIQFVSNAPLYRDTETKTKCK